MRLLMSGLVDRRKSQCRHSGDDLFLPDNPPRRQGRCDDHARQLRSPHRREARRREARHPRVWTELQWRDRSRRADRKTPNRSRRDPRAPLKAPKEVSRSVRHSDRQDRDWQYSCVGSSRRVSPIRQRPPDPHRVRALRGRAFRLRRRDREPIDHRVGRRGSRTETHGPDPQLGASPGPWAPRFFGLRGCRR